MAGTLLAQGEREIVTREDSGALMFERFATDPNVSVEKIERLMALWERGEARKSEAAFNASMSAAQKAMRPIVADSYNNQTRSKYASYEALDRAVRPVYTDHGFGLSFNTGDSPLAEHVRVKCHVTHQGGHAEDYHVDMPADGKGAKGGDVMTKTHAVGSALSYGQRYLLRLIFNLAVTDDDDGNKAAGAPPEPTPPEGFHEWWMDFIACADEGTAALERMWSEANKAPKTKVYLAFARQAKADQLKQVREKASRVAAS